jgi:hypothetical protein
LAAETTCPTPLFNRATKELFRFSGCRNSR